MAIGAHHGGGVVSQELTGHLAVAARTDGKHGDQIGGHGPRPGFFARFAPAGLIGLRREGKGRGRGQVDEVRFSEVDAAAALAANDSGSVASLRDDALPAVASDGLLRVSEVAALDVGDVQAEPDGSGRLFVGESKTDQEGQGAVLYLGR